MSKRRRPTVWNVQEALAWHDGQPCEVEYLAALITSIEGPIQGTNREGKPYTLVKLVLEDDSCLGNIVCALWDDEAHRMLQRKDKISKQPVCLSALSVCQWRGVRQLKWRRSTRVFLITDEPPCEEVTDRLTALYRWRTRHHAFPSQPSTTNGKEQPGPSEPSSAGPLSVASALELVGQGQVGSIKVKGFVQKVDRQGGVEERDAMDAGHRLIQRCNEGTWEGLTRWRYRPFWLHLSDKPPPLGDADKHESVAGEGIMLKVRVEDAVARAILANVPAAALAREAEQAEEDKGGEGGSSFFLTKSVEELLASLPSHATGPLLFRIRGCRYDPSQTGGQDHGDIEDGSFLLTGLMW